MPLFIRLLLASLYTSVAVAAEQPHEHEQHHSHVHGQAELLVAVDGQWLELELASPAMNIVGFEHPPANAAQAETVHQAIVRLQQPATLFLLPAAAGCELAEAEVETGLMAHADHAAEHPQEHGQAHVEEHHPADPAANEAHAEFHAHYRYQCRQPAALDRISVQLFEHFPGLQQIHAQTISDHGQHAAELDKQHHRLAL